MAGAKYGSGGGVRGQKRHVCATDLGVRDLCMEGRDCDEHDRAGERGEDVLGDDDEKVPALDHAVLGEDVHRDLGQNRGDEAANEAPHPQLHRREVGTPFAGVVAERDLEWEVDQHRQRHVFLREALVEQLEVGHGVVRLEADLGDQMDDHERLDVCDHV